MQIERLPLLGLPGTMGGSEQAVLMFSLTWTLEAAGFQSLVVGHMRTLHQSALPREHPLSPVTFRKLSLEN